MLGFAGDRTKCQSGAVRLPWATGQPTMAIRSCEYEIIYLLKIPGIYPIYNLPKKYLGKSMAIQAKSVVEFIRLFNYTEIDFFYYFITKHSLISL